MAFKVGDRVRRGPNWCYATQDLYKGRPSVGIVTEIQDNDEDVWCQVAWEGGYQNNYEAEGNVLISLGWKTFYKSI